ncbi:MAG: cysteine desulfurase family protein [Actinomycetota bacterium]
MNERYFDHHSTQSPSETARRVLAESIERFGDPLRLHERGRGAHRALEDAREQVAAALGAQPEEIVFTSGGTESVTLALHGTAPSAGERLVTGAVEHPSVLAAAAVAASAGAEVATAPVDEHGRIDVDRFAEEVRKPGTRVASVQHANHEVGTMQPVSEAASLAREAGALLHCDACQTVGKLPVDVGGLGVDLLSLSGHKFGGLPGVGALYVRRGVRLAGPAGGDDRERRRRSGLQNVAAILATGAALADALGSVGDTAAARWLLTARLRKGIDEAIPAARTHGHPTQRTPHLVCFSVEDVDPEVLSMSLDQRGFRLDAGSVVTGSPHEPSPVLAAMGLPGRVAFRASVGPGTKEEDVDALLDALSDLVAALRRMAT